MQKIVVLDGHTLNPGDLSWAPFEKFGEVTVYEKSSANEGIERSLNADVLVVNKFIVTSTLLEKAENIKMIIVTATGMNNIDHNAAKKLGIPVKNVAGYSTDAVAQQVFAYLMHIQNRVAEHHTSVQKGDWSRQPHFSYTMAPLGELADKVLGLYGFGTIGKRVATLASAFKMKILVHTEYPDPKFANVAFVSLESLFKKSDFISLHTQLTPEKEGIISTELLSLMKPTAWLINTARGGLIDEQALSKALDNNVLEGAALDVLSIEPPPAHHPLIGRNDVIITPHIAWATKEARTRLLERAAKHLED